MKLKLCLDNLKINKVVFTTGTHIEKGDAVFGDVKPHRIKRDYIMDVLNKRKNATAVDWIVLNNANMVKAFGYAAAEMENFADMCRLENGQLANEAWFRDFFGFYFNSMLPTVTRENRKYIKANDLKNDAVTLIYTVNDKEAHKAMKELLKGVCPNYDVHIINGDETTNAKAEYEARQAVKDHYEQYGNYNVIFIASVMANRSFSVPEIKNVVLACNAAEPDQKIARALTFWKLHPEIKAKIIDFRLSYGSAALGNYLSNRAIDTLDENATHKSPEQLLDEIRVTDKITFYEYFSAGVEPLRRLPPDELSKQMHSSTYVAARAVKFVAYKLQAVDHPRDVFTAITERLDFNGLTSTNFKGDAPHRKYVNKAIAAAAGKSERELAEDQRFHYLAYLLKHKDVFDSMKYETDVLKNEFERNMPVVRQQALENLLGMDMRVICQIAKLLIEDNIQIYG